jgi:hypothetical protein
MTAKLAGLDLRDDAINGFLEKVNEIIDAGVGAGSTAFGPVQQRGYGGIDATLTALDPGGRGVVELQGGDDSATRIAGIIATGYADGQSLFIVNGSSGLGDAQSLILLHESTAAAAANRITTPDRRSFKVGSNSVVLLMRAPLLDGSGNPTADSRWYVHGQCDFESVKTQDLQFYPPFTTGGAVGLSGTKNNWNPTGDAYGAYTYGLDGSDAIFKNHSLIRVGVDAAGMTITGMYSGIAESGTDLDKGTLKVVINFGPGPITFKHRSASSDATNQIQCPYDDDFVLTVGESAIFVHDTYWQVVSGPTSRLSPRRITVNPTDAAQDAVAITAVANQVNMLNATNSATGQTPAGNNARGFYSQFNGSYDCTANNIVAYGILAQVTATRSAGANGLTNVAVYGNASGGQSNYAGLFDGNVRVVGDFVTTGTAEIVGATILYGNVTTNSTSGSTLCKRSVRADNEVVPAQITASQNDYSPTGMADAAVLLINSAAAWNITGLATPTTGRLLWVYNTGAFNITLKHEDAGSAAANRFRGRGAADVVLTPSTGVQLYYSPSLTRWVVMTDSL